jgi:hypothetical protein
MPAELLRQAAQRLRLAAIGMALAWAGAILLNSLFEAAGWHRFSPYLDVIHAAMIGASVATAWLTHSGRIGPTQLLRLSLGYQVFMSLAISLGDHLEPMRTELTIHQISWLCVYIVIFAVFVPAPPRWALVAGLTSAATWPLAYFVGRAFGNPAVPAHVLIVNSAAGFIAVAMAMFAAWTIRGLQELGCYHLEEKLDHGGMGEIWRARHRMLARPVAVKLIRPELLGVKTPVEAASLVARFQREAEATAALHSSHTISLHDFGVTPEGAFYYVMELLDGLDLETLVRRYGPVPPERAIHILIQACDSLAEAHATGPHPPRRQALEHPDLPLGPEVGLRQGARLRAGQDRVDDGQRRPPDHGGHDHRDAGLHGSRGRARRRRARRARRHLRARLRRVLAADRRARVRGPHAGRGAAAPREDAAAAAVRACRTPAAGGARAARAFLSRQGPRRSPAVRGVAGRPPRRVRHRRGLDSGARPRVVGGEPAGFGQRLAGLSSHDGHAREPARTASPLIAA